MSISWQIPRNCLAWILVSQAALLAPHAGRLPWWVMATYVVCALWRVMVFQGRWSLPPTVVKVVLAALCFVGIYRNYGTLYGLEPTVALLYSGFSLKLLEVSNKRDVYILIFLAYFAALTAFLFSQDFTIAAFILFTLLLITTALVALHQHSYDQFNLVSVHKSSIIFLQAVPLMVVLFVIFPRFEPFWSVPMASHQAKMGISDTMAPGDIANLTQSGALAFRAVFERGIPRSQDMYWRGLVLSRFDGRGWHQGRWKQDLLSKQQVKAIRASLDSPITYRIIQEPSYQPWLFSLALAYSDEPKINIMSDYRLVRIEDVYSRITYQVLSDKRAIIEPHLSQQVHDFETDLPSGVNPRARQFAQQLWLKSLKGLESLKGLDSQDNQAFIDSVLNIFRQQHFFYTLKPPLLGKHSVDEFLFDTKKGFCSYYASSFNLMRMPGQKCGWKERAGCGLILRLPFHRCGLNLVLSVPLGRTRVTF
ncbi:MAG: transglutaminaseTgpA domain-containing protein [Pseudomonadales bacterium]